jgi:Rha family phage regulatory protein
MEKLITSIDGIARTTSLILAAKFEKRHADVLRDISSLEIPDDFRKCNFALVMESMTYVNSRGEKQTKQTSRVGYATITKDGFTLLCMGWTGKKAMKFKLDLIAQFNAMESALNKPSNLSAAAWHHARLEGKTQRKVLTDAVQRLVEYAKSQGSSNSEMYYANVTLLEYKALNLVAGQVKCKGLRDMLPTRQLAQLSVMEECCEKAIHEAIDKKLPYQDVYRFAQQRCLSMANHMNLVEKPFLEAQRKISK